MKNLALQGAIADFEKWQIIAGLEASERAEDDRLMEAVLIRAEVNPKVFLMRVIGHLNGVHTLGYLTDYGHFLATSPIWDTYLLHGYEV